MKHKIIYLLLITILMGTACAKEQSRQGNEYMNLEPLKVNVIFQPQQIEPNQEVMIQAEVYQGEEKVEDASEVIFEIWKKGEEDHEMIEAEHTGAGIYSIQKTFNEEGNYFIVSHVTARNLHSMPKQEFIVGQGE